MRNQHTLNRTDRILILQALALTLTIFSSGCGPQYVKKGKVADVIEQNMVTRSHIQSIGIGAADPKLASDTQKKATARSAAIVAAQYEMLSVIKGAEIEGGISVSRAMETDSTLEAQLKHTIRGAEIVSTRFTDDNGAVVILRLAKKRLKRLEGISFK